jgi:hypothetical protein
MVKSVLYFSNNANTPTSEYYFKNKEYTDLPGEVWKDIPGTEGSYEISDKGRIRSVDRVTVASNGKVCFRKGKIMAQAIIKYYNSTVNDYMLELVCTVRCNKKPMRFTVHRMMYDVFIGRINFKNDKLVVLHKDGDTLNNTTDNLKVATISEKAKRIYDLNRAPLLSNFITPESKQKGIVNRQKLISQYSLNGIKLNEYASIKEAEKATKINGSSISLACKQIKMVSAGGFLWVIGSGPQQICTKFYHAFKEKAKAKGKRCIAQYTTAGEFIQSFDSIKEAALFVGTHPDNIGHCVNGHVRKSAGYIWKLIKNAAAQY